jgi:hypothetical protein
MKKSVFILLICTLLPFTARAYDAYIGGVYYNLNKTDKTASVTYYKYAGKVVIPESIKYDEMTYSVTSIGNYAFSRCKDITSISIPNSVKSIGICAFEDCTGLNSISIPSSVTYIGGLAFSNTGWYNSQPDGLLYLDKCLVGYKGVIDEDITIDEGTRLMAGNAFANCQDLIFVSIPQSVISIGSCAFIDCTSLVSITIPDGVTSIETDTFNGCSGLISVTLGKGVTSIGAQAFNNCTGLTKINIPDGVTSIGNRAFYNCSSLSSITIPSNVSSIEDYTFYNCQNLVSLTIGEGVTSIGNYSFSNCQKVLSLTIPNSVKTIGNCAFQCCYILPSLIIPNSVTSIGERAFEGCNSIGSLTIPEGIKIIKKGTFTWCSSLESITIPSTIQYIYGEAFAYCTNIKEVIALPEVPPVLYETSFSNYDITLLVPEESIEAYMTTSPWSRFGKFQTLSGENVEIPKCATPTIWYENGKVKFNCDTEGVEFVSEVIVDDAKQYNDSELTLSQTYKISVYATKDGYEKSDVATREITITGNGKAIMVGDVNGDGIVNVADHVKLSDIIMNKNQ